MIYMRLPGLEGSYLVTSLQLRSLKLHFLQMEDQEFQGAPGLFRLHREGHEVVASQQWGQIQPTGKELLKWSLFPQQPDVSALMQGQRRRLLVRPCRAGGGAPEPHDDRRHAGGTVHNPRLCRA